MTAARTLRQHDPNARIAILSDDPHTAYFRAALTNYLLGELREDQLWAVPPDFYDTERVQRILCRVVGVDTANNQVWDATGSGPIEYDKLFIGSGARPRAPDFPGAHLPGVMTMRTIIDVRSIADRVAQGGVKSAVVLGGGPLGLEWAHGLHERGAHVTLVERSTRLMKNVLDDVGSDLLAARLRAAGIEVYLGENVVQAYPNQQGEVGAVTTNTGRAVQCDVVAVAFGVQCNSEFLQGSQVALDDRGRIFVDASMRTRVGNVWAAGDVAVVDGECLQLWEPARRQALVAATNMAGGHAVYKPGPHYLATRLFDLDFASIGQVNATSEHEVIVDFPRDTGSIAYRKLVLRAGRLVGAQMLGERQTRVRRLGRGLAKLVKSQIDVSSIKGKLLTSEFDIDGWLETKKLLEAPVAKKSVRLVNLAKLKGTQAIQLGAGKSLARPPKNVSAPKPGTAFLVAPALARGAVATDRARATRAIEAINAGTMVLPSGQAARGAPPPRQTRMLSIGLMAEAPKATTQSAALSDAQLCLGETVWQLKKSATRIGSGQGIEVCLQHLSPLHAEISWRGETPYLMDMGSQTGTRVNGSLLSTPHRLQNDDAIQVGNYELLFRCPRLGRKAGTVQFGAPRRGLEVMNGTSMGLFFALGQTPISIGSGPSCQVLLREAGVSPQHAVVQPSAHGVTLTDLGSPVGTSLGGSRLTPNQPVAIVDEMIFHVGSIGVRLGQRRAAGAAFQVGARITVDQGTERGRSFTLPEQAVVGSDAASDITLSGLFPRHLELKRHGASYLVRDLTGQGQSFRAGAPLGSEFVEISDGDLLLCAGQVMLRFEEDA